MKTSFTLVSFFLCILSIIPMISKAQDQPQAPTAWSIVASYTIPGKASGLAWDGAYIYFGIYGSNGSNIHKFNPTTGTSLLQCNGAFDDAYGLTYKSPNLVTIDQPGSSSTPSNALEFNMSGTTISTLALPDHYMSGIAYDAGTWWVCTYYPDNGTIYHLSSSGSILSQFTPPANQPWDICKQGNNLWIADYNANTLYKVSEAGTVIESHSCADERPSGVVYDGTYLWYCDGPLGSNSTLYKVDLTGSGTPAINVPVTSHNYGTVTLGEFATWNCTVQNTGNANLTITEIEIPGGQPVSTTFTTPQTITPGLGVSVPLKYTPVAAIPLNTQVIIHSSDPINPEVTVTLTGNGVYQGPHLVLQQPGYNFGIRRAGAFSRWMLPVSNDGDESVLISDFAMSSERFFVDESLSLPVIIPTLATSYIPVWFNPTEDEAYSGILSIVSNATQGTVYADFSGLGEVSLHAVGTPLWTYLIDEGFDNSAKCIVPGDDISGDGIADIIVGSEDNFIRCFNGNASVTGDVLWEKEIPSGAVYQQTGISITGDINNDGYMDVIIGSAWGGKRVIALSGKTGQQLWMHDTGLYGDGGWIYAVDSKYDYNSDGFPDVLAAAGDDGNDTGPKRIYCLNGLTGIPLWEKPTGGPAFSVIGVQDFTGDGKPDVLGGASNASETIGAVYGIDGSNGAQKWVFNTPGSSVWALLQLDDITGDGKKDVAVGDFGGNVFYLNGATGANVQQRSIGNVLILRMVELGDANNNGYSDVLVAHSGTNGVLLDGSTCNYIWQQPLADKSWCVANIGDITFDGEDDAIIGTLYQNNYAYFLDGPEGSILNSYPAADPVDALNAIPDITGDNTMELMFSDRNGLLTCLSGGFDSTTIAVRYTVIEPLTFKIYSNPNDGYFSVKITCREELQANLRITDMRGMVVYEWAGLNLETGDHVAELNLTNELTSGVYLLEVTTAKGSHREKLVIQK